jgi:hypothetical protein
MASAHCDVRRYSEVGLGTVVRVWIWKLCNTCKRSTETVKVAKGKFFYFRLLIICLSGHIENTNPFCGAVRYSAESITIPQSDIA